MNQIEDIAVQHQICKATYSLCRVVGYKYVLKHFPHEVNHLEECLFLLKKQVSATLCKCIILTNLCITKMDVVHRIDEQDKGDHENWETTYVLLHWLAALCLIPFDICSMDSTAGMATVGKSTLVVTIVHTCKSFMQDTGPTRDAASICLSVLLTRPDMENAHLEEFMVWATMFLNSFLQLPVVERSNLCPQYFLALGVLHADLDLHCASSTGRKMPPWEGYPITGVSVWLTHLAAGSSRCRACRRRGPSGTA